MIRRPPRSTLFPYTDALPICHFLATVLPRGLFRIKPRVVIGVPSGITEMERRAVRRARSEEHTSELQSRQYIVCRLLLEKKNITQPQRQLSACDVQRTIAPCP